MIMQTLKASEKNCSCEARKAYRNMTVLLMYILLLCISEYYFHAFFLNDKHITAN